MPEIRFTERDAPWNKGDVVDVTAAQAAKLVGHGVAEYVSAPEPEPKAKRGARG